MLTSDGYAVALGSLTLTDRRMHTRFAVFVTLIVCAMTPLKTLADSSEVGTTFPTIEVTTSKFPEATASTPAMITVISGEDLRERGATDLRTALSLVAGVDIAAGGDAGPAASVPGMWGLREFDAFLLVVDGIPSGGTFNPALTTLDLENVERIEVLRGAAPVMYGATSFVGVIQIIHYAAGETPSRASIGAGTRSTGRAAISTNLSDVGIFKQSISANVATQQFSQDRSGVDRGHILYRALADAALGKIHIDIDATALRQDPYSPHPVEGGTLSPRFPLDANINPTDAKQDQNRIQVSGGYERKLGDESQWVTTLSIDHSSGRNTRGFLRDGFADDGVTHNADGFRQRVSLSDAYFDSFLAIHPADELVWTLGLDWLYGDGKQNSNNFEYGVLPNGANAPNSHSLQVDESTQLKDKRSFGGIYTQADWKLQDRLDVIGGIRLNHTVETRSGQIIDRHADPGTPPETNSDTQSKTRVSGVIGINYAVWKEQSDQLNAFADYRNTYKPAAIDFGPEAEGSILKPETADSWEAGLKGRLMGGQFDWEVSYFHLNFANLVIPENIGGLPGLANSGKSLFQGAELEAEYHFSQDLRVRATYAYHDARYTQRLVQLPDGSFENLAHNRLEVSPQNLVALGLVYAPNQGLQGSIVSNYVGRRFLDQENQAPARAYVIFDAGLGYRFSRYDLRLDAYNLSNRRDPVAVSELGNGQMYRLPGRSAVLSANFAF